MKGNKMFTREQLAPLPDDMTGHICVIAASCLGSRWQLPKFQLIRVTGGFGAVRGNLGSKVYGEHLADGEWRQLRSNDFIGVASQEQIDEAMADERGELPIDPANLGYLVIGKGLAFGKSKDLAEAKKLCRQNGKPMLAYHCHMETQLTDMGSLQWPHGAPEPKLVWEAKV
jgi:hypothetical protein